MIKQVFRTVQLLVAAFALAFLNPGEVAAEEAIHVEMVRATIRPGELTALTKRIDVVALIENNSDTTVHYVLIGINAYGANDNELRINPVRLTASELLYAERLGRVELVRISGGLQPGETVTRTYTLELPSNVATNVQSLSVTFVGGGGDEFAEQLLSSPLVPPQVRSSLASELSTRKLRQYSYLTDAGTWATPPGFDHYLPAPRTRGENTFQFDRQRIEGTSSVISIRNAASQNITLNLMGGDTSQRIVLTPGQSRTLTLNPGQYSFTATSNGVRPLSDVETFDAGHEYSWRFWISTSYR